MEGLRYFEGLDLKAVVRWEGDLPHWEAPGVPVFLTYRLADSLTVETYRRLRAERRRGLVRTNLEQVYARFGKHIREVDDRLHEGSGECVLKNPQAARIVAETLHFFDGERYDLHAWCIMPNHVHVVAVFREAGMLARCVKSWKSFAAKQVYQLVGREGPLFQRQYFDHLIRTGRNYDSICGYLARNPRMAGIDPWSWVWRRGDPLLVEARQISEAASSARMEPDQC